MGILGTNKSKDYPTHRHTTTLINTLSVFIFAVNFIVIFFYSNNFLMIMIFALLIISFGIIGNFYNKDESNYLLHQLAHKVEWERGERGKLPPNKLGGFQSED